MFSRALYDGSKYVTVTQIICNLLLVFLVYIKNSTIKKQKVLGVKVFVTI